MEVVGCRIQSKIDLKMKPAWEAIFEPILLDFGGLWVPSWEENGSNIDAKSDRQNDVKNKGLKYIFI